MLEAVRWQISATGQEVSRAIKHLFLFIGAEPNTEWLSGSGIALDPKGFILTGADAGGDCRQWETPRSGVSPSQSAGAGGAFGCVGGTVSPCPTQRYEARRQSEQFGPI